jgi:DNA-binding response OmpR family regulator
MTIHIVGRFEPHHAAQLQASIAAVCPSAAFEDVAEACSALQSGEPPAAVFVRAGHPALENLVGWMRGRPGLWTVPIVAVVDDDDPRAEIAAFAAGVDDVVEVGDAAAVRKRAEILAGIGSIVPTAATLGRCIVAHPGRLRRQVLGRVMRLAGFEVTFAADVDEVLAAARRGDAPCIAIVAHGAEMSAPSIVARLREQVGHAVPCVVLSTTGGAVHAVRPFAGLSATAIATERSPADEIVFLVNELLRPAALQDVRKTPRLLYATPCWFRVAGSAELRRGMVYNASCGGLYVRTLDAPVQGSAVWIEAHPPGGRALVHLRGKAVWVRPLAARTGGASPPGFGVELVAEACPVPDLRAWEQGCRALAQYEAWREDDEPQAEAG